MPGSRRQVLPGFGLSLGYTLTYLSLIVLIPLSALAIKAAKLPWHEVVSLFSDPLVTAAFKLSLSASLAAASINGVMGFITAWTLIRYPFFGRKLFDSIVDLPFAMPTAVAGLTFASIFADIPYLIGENNDWWRVTLMLVFVGLPFVIRTLQPVLLDLDADVEQAAASLGAGPLKIFRSVIFPVLLPAWISGVALAFARGVGEYGSVIFVSGNIPGKSQIVPQLIIEKLDQFNYPRATAVGLGLLLISLAMLLVLNGIDYWSRRYDR